MTLQPLKLYGHSMGPNPFKVEIILAELDLPYKRHEVEFADMKKPEFEAVNPNGRYRCSLPPASPSVRG